MQNKTTRIIISGLATVLLILAVAGSASAVSFEVDLPSTATPGETVTGYVWIKDAGAIENNISAYQADLIADAVLNLYIDYTMPYLNLSSSSFEYGGAYVNNRTFIAEAYGGKAYVIDSSAEKLCTFKLTIPSAASVGTMYTVDFNCSLQRTILITYTTYYDDGILGHGSSHGSLAKAALTRVNDTITVAVPTYSIGNFTVNGNVTANRTQALAGAIVHVVATPDTGYHFVSWNVTNSTGGLISVDDDGNFVMPAENVNAGAVFAPDLGLELVSYNGWVKGMNQAKTAVGAYLKDATTGQNISDPNTGDDYLTKTADENKGFNASIAGMVVYNLSGYSSGDYGMYSPKLYKTNGLYQNLTRGSIQAYSASGTPLGSVVSFNCSLLPEDAEGKYVFNETHFSQQDAAYYLITFTGRKLGDVDNNPDVTLADSTSIKKYVVDLLTFTDAVKFYADISCDGSVTLLDSTTIKKMLVDVPTYYWV